MTSPFALQPNSPSMSPDGSSAMAGGGGSGAGGSLQQKKRGSNALAQILASRQMSAGNAGQMRNLLMMSPEFANTMQDWRLNPMAEFF